MMSMQYMNTYSLGVIEEEEKDYAEKPPHPELFAGKPLESMWHAVRIA